MKKTHFLMIGMLLFSCIAVNFVTPINAEEFHGTRSPDADVRVSSPSNQTGEPTETLSYQFIVNNTGDETDNFTVSAVSGNDWLVNWSDHDVGPLSVNESITVTVNISIPMGTPADTIDSLTLTATSDNDDTVTNETTVNTTVEEAFVVEIEIEGGTPQTSNVYPGVGVNYTLTLRNKGNDNVTITINYFPSTSGWNVTFPRFPDRKVFIEEATTTTEGIETVNMTITAPSDAQPDDELELTIWAEKTDLPEPWYSWERQENITITSTVQPSLGVIFDIENIEGFVTSGDTLYNFTIVNTGNKEVIIDLVVDKDNDLIANLIGADQVTLGVGKQERKTLAVGTAPNTPLGNYTINISAIDNATGAPLVVGSMELYYIIVPILNITNISVSDAKPLQFRTTEVIVTIENIGYVNAGYYGDDVTDITIKLYDGSNKVGEAHLDALNASEEDNVKIKWAPSDHGNRTIRVSIDVKGQGGKGDFSAHGTDIAEKSITVYVKLNWEPFYLAIYIIIVIILGVAFLSGVFSLKYYGGGYPHLDEYPEGAEEMPYDEGYPAETPEAPLPERGEEEGERAFGAFGMGSETEEYKEQPLRYKEPGRGPMEPMPEMRRRPMEREAAPTKDPETLRKENELRDEISRFQDRLDRSKSFGVDRTNIEQLLKTTKRSLNEGDYIKAGQYLSYANERLDSLMARREEAQNAIKEAKEILSGIRGTTDLTIVENFLVKADSLFEEGDYKEATNYARKAKDRAVRLQRRELRL